LSRIFESRAQQQPALQVRLTAVDRGRAFPREGVGIERFLEAAQSKIGPAFVQRPGLVVGRIRVQLAVGREVVDRIAVFAQLDQQVALVDQQKAVIGEIGAEERVVVGRGGAQQGLALARVEGQIG
jgi:hypothetical protein